MLESKVYADFKKYVDGIFEVERLENAISSGAFDCILSAGNRTLWVEFKKSQQEKLRGTQAGWVIRRMRRSCLTDMLVVTKSDDHQNFIVVLAADMAKADRKICDTPRVLVAPVQLAAFLAETYIIGEADGSGSDQQGTGEDNRGHTRH